MSAHPEVPFSNRSTSLAAAHSIAMDLSSMESKVLGVVYRAEGQGVTCDEVEVAMGWSHQTVSARINGLMRKEMIADSGFTRRTRSGRSAIVWVSRHLAPAPDATHQQPLPEVRPVREAKAVQQAVVPIPLPPPPSPEVDLKALVKNVATHLQGLTLAPGKTALYVQNGYAGVFAPPQLVTALVALVEADKAIALGEK